MSSELLTHQFFAPLVGALFHIAVGEGSIALRLDEVTPLSSEGRGNVAATGPGDTAVRTEPFSLLFSGPPDVLLPQRTYPMAMDAAPAPLEIFIVPVGQTPDGFIYQAIFG